MSIRNELLESILTATGGALTPEQEATLSHFRYDVPSNTLIADRSIQTILSSLFLGEGFKLSSGADQVMTTNLLTDIDYFSPGSGIKDQSILANQDVTGLIPLSTPVLGDDLIFLEANGPEDTSGAVNYEGTNIVPLNVASFGIKFTFEEPIVNADFLFYEIFAGTDDTGKLIYQQLRTNLSMASGSTFDWFFTNPLFGTTGLQIYTRLSIAKGGEDEPRTILQVRRSSTMPTRHWVESKFRSWEEVEVFSVFGTEFEEFSSIPESSTTSSSFQSKLSVTTALKPAGKYRIMFNAQATNKDGDKATEVEFEVDGVAQHNHSDGGDYITVISKEDNQWTSEFVVSYITLGSPSTIDLDINYRKDDKTARISDARIEIWRVI